MDFKDYITDTEEQQVLLLSALYEGGAKSKLQSIYLGDHQPLTGGPLQSQEHLKQGLYKCLTPPFTYLMMLVQPYTYYSHMWTSTAYCQISYTSLSRGDSKIIWSLWLRQWTGDDSLIKVSTLL
jgi:hypothetical protein